MKKKRIFFMPLFALLFIVSGFQYEAQGQVEGKWSGTITLHETYVGLTGTSEKQITVFLADNIGHGSIKMEGYTKFDPSGRNKSDCNGTGVVDLVGLSFNRWKKIYTIETEGPTCSNGSDPQMPRHGNDILIMDQPLGSNPNILAGTQTIVGEDPLIGKVTTTLTWNLTRTSPEVELIVTPANYDNWRPEPGPDEIRKGSVMEIFLKVRRKNGQPLSEKAKTFEIRLANTSKEPGITLNAPLTPSPDQLPDLRLLPLAIGESKNADQFLSMNCSDGSTGKVYVGSYDGGGYTTLIVEAILDDGSHIQGNLLLSGGITEIPVPKRTPGAKIAISWLTANGNPAENDDNEKSNGNTNDGDGLSAYEEYRGVISKGQFQRLDPNKKELGVKIKKTEFPLFSDGVVKFENATGLTVIRFDENEIGSDRRLNKNNSSAHIYDQYALRLEKGRAPADVVGFNDPRSVIDKLPEQSDRVVVDIDQLKVCHNYYRTNGMNMPFTEKEEIASTTAHELGHGVGLPHHGLPNIMKDFTVLPGKNYIILSKTGDTIRLRPYKLKGKIGERGNEESGDLSCIMSYTDYYSWAVNRVNGIRICAEVPDLPVGKLLCISPDGKGINAKPNFFYDAGPGYGNCRGKIKLRP